MSAKPLDEEALFHAARRIADPAARSLFLNQACGDDAALAGRVRALLAIDADETADSAPPPERTGNFEPLTERVGTKIGPYVLREQIGEGGFGLVFVAEQTEPVKRKVALKVIKPGMDSRQVIARFEAERQALALMDHPNIARVLDAGATESGRPYFVMELVRGIPITEYCDKNQLPPKERLELFITVCQAIQHAHQKGIIHRDVKPSNVLVTSHDGKPVAKVIDFGVAKAVHQQLTDRSIYTNFATMVGTPLYMSPEQAEMSGLDIDTRSDIYSLGVLLYELLTGTTPLDRTKFAKAAYDEVRRLIREEEPPKPSTRLSTSDSIASIAAQRHMEPAKLSKFMRGDLDWITMKCLEKDRTRRYETANGLARDIQRFLSDEAVEACPPSATYRLRKYARRNKGQILAACSIVFALLGGLIATSYGLFRADQERMRAIAAELNAIENATKAMDAAEAERVANEKTTKRLTQIKLGMELFAGMLYGINPQNEEKGDPPVYQLLLERARNAADQLDSDTVGDPLVVANLQSILGHTICDLGDAKKAIVLLNKARITQYRELGHQHLNTLTTLYYLAQAHYADGNYLEAIRILEEMRTSHPAVLNADAEFHLLVLSALGMAYLDTGKWGDAIQIYEKDCLPLMGQTRNRGLELNAMNNLGGAYSASGRLDDAIRIWEQVRQQKELDLPKDHPDTLRTINNLGNAYRLKGDFNNAIALLQYVYGREVAKLGADHPSTLITQNNLALAHRDAGQVHEAIRILQDACRRKLQRFGADHPSTLVTFLSLARTYAKARHFSDATAYFEKAASGMRKLGYQNERAGAAVTSAIDWYEQTGDLTQAENWRREWVMHVMGQLGVDSPAYAGELAGLGDNLLRQKKYVEAEHILSECLTRRQSREPNAWTTFNTRSMLGGALLGQKKYTNAESHLVQGYDGMKQHEDKIPKTGGAERRIPEALDRLIELYTATNQPDEAKKWRAERSKYKESAPPPRKANPR